MQQAHINYIVLAQMFWLECARVRVMKEMISCAMVIDCLRVSNQWHSAISGQVLFVASYVIVCTLGSSFLGTTVGNVLFILDQVNFVGLPLRSIILMIFIILHNRCNCFNRFSFMKIFVGMAVIIHITFKSRIKIKYFEIVCNICIIVRYISLKLWLISVHMIWKFSV